MKSTGLIQLVGKLYQASKISTTCIKSVAFLGVYDSNDGSDGGNVGDDGVEGDDSGMFVVVTIVVLVI